MRPWSRSSPRPRCPRRSPTGPAATSAATTCSRSSARRRSPRPSRWPEALRALLLLWLAAPLAAGRAQDATRGDDLERSLARLEERLGSDQAALCADYEKALAGLVAYVGGGADPGAPAEPVTAFAREWTRLQAAVDAATDPDCGATFRLHAEALGRWLGAAIRPAGGAGAQVVSGGADLSALYARAAWGDQFRLEGAFTRLTLDRAPPPGPHVAPIRLLGPARLAMNPVGGSNTLSVWHAGPTVFQDLVLEPDDTAAVMFSTHTRHVGLHFESCRIGLASGKGWNAETDQGFRGKWGVLSYELDDFRFEDGEVVGIEDEHCFYHHNPRARSRDADAIVIRNTTMKWAGRTAVQVVARDGEGPAGRGNVRIEHCVIEDVCLEDGGGGSALTFRGNLDGAVRILDTRVHLGGNPKLNPRVSGNITGALVMDVAPGESTAGTRELVIDGCHFEVGPCFVGEGTARRNNVDISHVGRVTIRGTTILNHPGARAALCLDGATIDHLVLDAANDIRGDCILEGLGTFPDPDRDGSGYRGLLAAVAAARDLPEDDPRRGLADKVEVLSPDQ